MWVHNVNVVHYGMDVPWANDGGCANARADEFDTCKCKCNALLHGYIIGTALHAKQYGANSQQVDAKRQHSLGRILEGANSHPPQQACFGMHEKDGDDDLVVRSHFLNLFWGHVRHPAREAKRRLCVRMTGHDGVYAYNAECARMQAMKIPVDASTQKGGDLMGFLHRLLVLAASQRKIVRLS